MRMQRLVSLLHKEQVLEPSGSPRLQQLLLERRTQLVLEQTWVAVVSVLDRRL